MKFEIKSEEYNAEVEKDCIISQDPTYTEKYNNVKEGSTVKVVISKGAEKTTVPKVVGMQEDEAVKALEEAKLKAEIVEETSKKVEEGYVISQETDANTEANAGDTVKIHVSTGTGIKQVTMIDVKGKTEADAKTTLEKLGLVVNIGSSEDKSKDNGVVLTQSIEVGKVKNIDIDVNGNRVDLDWSKVTNADEYEVYLSKNSKCKIIIRWRYL